MRKLSRLEKYHMNKVSMRRPSKVIAVTPAAIEFEKRAIEREKKGQFRIAARFFGFSVWMLLLVMLSVQGSRFAGTNVSQKVTAFAVATIAA